MHSAYGLAPLAVVDDERDVALGRALRDGDDVHRRIGNRAEDARRDAGHVGHPRADHRDRRQSRLNRDVLDLVPRQLLAKILAQVRRDLVGPTAGDREADRLLGRSLRDQ